MTEEHTVGGPDVFPDGDELPDDPPDISDIPIADIDSDGAEALTQFTKKDWEKSTTARERVRAVMRQVTAKQFVSDVADAADVSETTARSELDTLVEQGIVVVNETDNGKQYVRNPDYHLFKRVNRLSKSGDIVEQVQRVREEIQQYQSEYDSQSPEDLLLSDQSLDDEGLEDVSYWKTAERKLKFLRAAYRLRELRKDILSEKCECEVGAVEEVRFGGG